MDSELLNNIFLKVIPAVVIVVTVISLLFGKKRNERKERIGRLQELCSNIETSTQLASPLGGIILSDTSLQEAVIVSPCYDHRTGKVEMHRLTGSAVHGKVQGYAAVESGGHIWVRLTREEQYRWFSRAGEA